MKKILFLTFLLTSCTSTPEKASVVKESTEIIGDYVDTLENSIGDAKSAVDDMNKVIEAKNEQINK